MGSEITSDLESKLKTYIQNTPELMATAKACVEVGLPNFYIAGGSITQLIWNTLSGESALKGIKIIFLLPNLLNNFLAIGFLSWFGFEI